MVADLSKQPVNRIVSVAHELVFPALLFDRGSLVALAKLFKHLVLQFPAKAYQILQQIPLGLEQLFRVVDLQPKGGLEILKKL